MDADEAIAVGRFALERGDWISARTAFQDALVIAESAEALECFGTACWWQDDQQAVLNARERAYRLYREQNEARSAARLATLLALDYADYHGDLAVSNGWLRRAESLLKTVEPSPEHSWLNLYQGFISLMYENDLPEARRCSDLLVELTPRLQSLDIEMVSLALRGHVLVREGKLTEGLRHLDEAMTAAVGGEMTDLSAVGNTCCSLIYACEAIADYNRADQWCERTRQFCRRLGMDLFFAICRNYYATVLIWRGAWQEADLELSAALKELESNRPGYAMESLAKLGELRRRQGRIDEALSFFAQAEPHRTALFGQGMIALDRGDTDTAIDLFRRVLRRVGVEDQAERVFVLEMLVRAYLATGQAGPAIDRLEELEAVANLIGTQPLQATALAVRGFFHQDGGDLEQAKQCFEDAIDLFESAHAPFESARIRLEYAAALKTLGRPAAALEQAMIAQSSCKRIGAALYADRASRLAASLSSDLGPVPSARTLGRGLTPREAEVLWLVAAGKTNQDIAAGLVLSVRTVERHISTIYEKLELSGRAARAAAAAIALSTRAGT